MATVTAALLCACAAVLVYDRIAARDSMRNDLEVMAEMLGANSTAALSFEDAASGGGNSVLAAREASDRGGRDSSLPAGRSLASYRRASAPPSAMPAVTADGVWFEPHRLVAFKSVMLSGAKLGTLYLESDLEQLDTTLRRFAWIMAAILAGRVAPRPGACLAAAGNDSRSDRPSGARRENRLQRKEIFDAGGEGFRRRSGTTDRRV